MFMTDGTHDSRQGAGGTEKDGRFAELTRERLRGLRPVVVGPVVVVTQVLGGVAHGVGQRVEALAGNGDRVAVLVARLPHPLAAMATDGLELDFHAPGICKTLHRRSPPSVAAAAVGLREEEGVQGKCHACLSGIGRARQAVSSASEATQRKKTIVNAASGISPDGTHMMRPPRR